MDFMATVIVTSSVSNDPRAAHTTLTHSSAIVVRAACGVYIVTQHWFADRRTSEGKSNWITDFDGSQLPITNGKLTASPIYSFNTAFGWTPA